MIKSQTTKILALVLSLFIILPVVNISVAAPLKGSVNDTYDRYFNDEYSNLTDQDHVFRTLTYHELDYLLDSEGTYVVWFGGAWNADAQAVIAYINEVAKESGVEAIHNFDPRLDGKTIDITDNQFNPYTRRYVEIVNKYLTNLQDHNKGSEEVSFANTVVSGRAPNQTTRVIEGSAPKVDVPFLFVYNKDNSKPIIKSLEGIDALLTDGKVDTTKADAYKAQLRDVFKAIPGKADILLNNDYISSSYNEFSKATIFDDSDKDIVIEPVTYDELIHIFESEGNYAIIFGCSWCGNTQAAIKFVNEYAKKYNIDTVYNWDTKLDGGIGGTPGVEAGTDSSNFLHTRDTNHPYAHIYVDFVRQYLPNIETLYAIEDNNVSYMNDSGQELVVNKLQVPYVFLYNKDHKDENGNPAPILDHVELMYSWTNIQPDYERDGKRGVNYNNYTEALDRLYSTLHQLAPQEAPTGLTGKAPSSATAQDGEITGVSADLEYKRAEDRSYSKVSGESIKGLANGTYYVRAAANDQFKASPSVIIDLNLEQASPTSLQGAAPSSSANDDGRVQGTTIDLEYRLAGEEKFNPATEPFTGQLAPGTYEVRAKVKYGFNPSSIVEVVVPSYAGVNFTDVAVDAWYNKAASVLVNSGIASDVTETAFNPNASITTGQFIQWFLKGFQVEAASLGITNAQLQSEGTISRQDAIKLLYDALGIEALPASDKTAELSSYSDAGKIKDSTKPAIQAFVNRGIINGYNNQLNPDGLTTRAEAALILYTLLTK